MVSMFKVSTGSTEFIGAQAGEFGRSVTDWLLSPADAAAEWRPGHVSPE